MRRMFVLLAGIVVLGASLASAPALASRRSTLQVRRTRVGTILVDSQGYTLYTFSQDGRNRDVCAKLAGCLYTWPALVSGRPSAGAGVKRGLIGTIKVQGVGRQVTYAGHPLYTYVGDNRAGETDNINIYQSGGYWPAITASGRAIK
jgi:predicted lipoprotein with Yx(FWY)xxD motif